MAKIKRTIPAIQGHSGPFLLTYQTQLNPSGIIELLGHDPREIWKKKSDIDEAAAALNRDIQRHVTKERRASSGGYIADRASSNALLVGGFPAISVGFTYRPEFTPFDADEPDMGALDCAGPKGMSRMILDGLGRATGILDKLDEGKLHDADMTIPVTIYVPKNGTFSVRELGQLFRDFNFLAVRVTPAHSMALDHSDLYGLLTEKIAETPVIKIPGGMEKRAATLGKKSTAFVVQKDLLRFVRGALEGTRVQEANLTTAATPNLTRESFESMLANLTRLLDGFAARMGSRFSENRTDLHRSSAGWQAIGLVFHDLLFNLQASEATTEKVLNGLGLIDWSRYNQAWVGMLGEPDTNGTPNALGQHPVTISKAGRSNRESLYRYLTAKTGIDAMRPINAQAAE